MDLLYGISEMDLIFADLRTEEENLSTYNKENWMVKYLTIIRMEEDMVLTRTSMKLRR